MYINVYNPNKLTHETIKSGTSFRSEKAFATRNQKNCLKKHFMIVSGMLPSYFWLKNCTFYTSTFISIITARHVRIPVYSALHRPGLSWCHWVMAYKGVSVTNSAHNPSGSVSPRCNVLCALGGLVIQKWHVSLRITSPCHKTLSVRKQISPNDNEPH